MFEPETLEKGDFLTKTGSRCRKLSFVKSGMLRVFAYSEDKEVTQWISTASYFTTDLASFIFESPFPLDYTSLNRRRIIYHFQK